MATKDESLLLALPLELLTRITDSLHDESLSTLRLTCKTLEQANFDRFARGFETAYCCIFYEQRWLSLRSLLNGAPRLVAKIKQFHFTTDLLERGCWQEAQIAPGPDFDGVTCAQWMTYGSIDYEYDFEEAGLEHRLLPGGHQPSAELVTSVLSDLQELAPDTTVAFDFTSNQKAWNMDIKIHEDVLIAIAATELWPDVLKLSHQYTRGMKELTTRVGPSILACLPCLMIFEYDTEGFGEGPDEEEIHVSREGELEERVQIVEDIIRGADYLEIFRLDLRQFRCLPSPWVITERLLHACNIESLTYLGLKDVVISEKQLLRALSRCKTELIDVSLRGIEMRQVEHGWPAVFRSLSNLRLGTMVLFDLKVQGSPRLDFAQMKRGSKLKMNDPFFGYEANGNDESLGLGVRFG